MMFGFNHLVTVAATGEERKEGKGVMGQMSQLRADPHIEDWAHQCKGSDTGDQKKCSRYCYWGADPFGASTGTCPHESRREINLLGTLFHERMLLLSNVAFQLFITRVDQQKPCRGRCKNTYQLHESIMIPSRSCQHTACSYWS